MTEHKAGKTAPLAVGNQPFKINIYNDARKGKPNKIPFVISQDTFEILRWFVNHQKVVLSEKPYLTTLPQVTAMINFLKYK